LQCKCYIRYVDDFILLDKTKEKLKYLRNKIDEFLKEKLSLQLNSNKTRIQSLNKGIDFLGYFIKPNYILVRRRVIRKLKSKLFKVNSEDKNELRKDKVRERTLAMINSYYGHFRHAFSFNLRKNIYKNHLGYLQESFLPKVKYTSLKIK